MGQFRKPQEFLVNVFILFYFFIHPSLKFGYFVGLFNKIKPGFPLIHDLVLEGRKEDAGRVLGRDWLK